MEIQNIRLIGNKNSEIEKQDSKKEEFNFVFKPGSFGGKNCESTHNTSSFDSWDA